MNAMEPLADIATAGVVARAVEPDTGLDASGPTTEQHCLNCGTGLVGSYCHDCGQKGHVHRTLHAFAHDLLHGVLHFEGKIFRTLPMLMLRPGELTRRYIAGERARFVSPLALFLFCVFLMFAAVSMTGGLAMDGDDLRADAERSAKLGAEEIMRLERARTAALAAGNRAEADRLTEAIQDEKDVVAFTDALGGSVASATSDDTEQAVSFDKDSESPTTKVRMGGSAVVGFQPESALDKAYKAAKANPKLLIYKLQTNAYKFSWALIILSVPFMALLFLWRWRPLYDHAVFVTYSITAVSILVILGSLLALAGVKPEPLLLAGILFIPWHMYRQLRGGYQLRRFSALWRTAALLVFANLALSLFAFGLLMLGVLG